MSDDPADIGRLRRTLYVALGLFFVALGFLGAVLPVLPTTPFLLLASALFVRSSPRLNRWLLRSRIFGPFLRDWQRHRGVRLSVKLTATVMMLIAAGCSAWFADLSWPWLLVLLTLVVIGLTVVWRLRTVPANEATAARTPASEHQTSPGPSS